MDYGPLPLCPVIKTRMKKNFMLLLYALCRHYLVTNSRKNNKYLLIESNQQIVFIQQKSHKIVVICLVAMISNSLLATLFTEQLSW